MAAQDASALNQPWSEFKADSGWSVEEEEAIHHAPGVAFTVDFRTNCRRAENRQYVLVYPPTTNMALFDPRSPLSNLNTLTSLAKVYDRVQQVYGRTFYNVDPLAPLFINQFPEAPGVYAWVLVNHELHDTVVFLVSKALTSMEIGTEHTHVLRRAEHAGAIDDMDGVIVAGEMRIEEGSAYVVINFCSGSYTKRILERVDDPRLAILQFEMLVQNVHAHLMYSGDREPLALEVLTDEDSCNLDSSFLPRLLNPTTLAEIAALEQAGFYVFQFPTKEQCVKQYDLHSPVAWVRDAAARHHAFIMSTMAEGGKKRRRSVSRRRKSRSVSRRRKSRSVSRRRFK